MRERRGLSIAVGSWCMEGIGALPQRSEKLMRPAVVHVCLSEQHEDEHAWSASSVQCG